MSLAKALPEKFRPDGFELIEFFPRYTTLYGFDPQMAWEKRQMTVVDGDQSKPSQVEYLYTSSDSRITIALVMMYISRPLEPDIVGFVSVPDRQGNAEEGSELSIRPPLTDVEIFSYGNAIVVLQAFPTTPDPDVKPMDLINEKKDLGLQLREFLDQQSGE